MRSILTLVLLATPVLGQETRLQVQEMIHPDGKMQWSFFGEAAAIDGTRAVVGTGPGLQDVVTYQWSGDQWVVEAKIPNPFGTAEGFGSAVDVSGDVVVVGSPSADVAAATAGAVFVYRFIDGAWVQEGLLTAPDPQPGDELGFSVAVDGDRLIAGAPDHTILDEDGITHGAAYGWAWDGVSWNFTNKLQEKTPRTNDYLGWDLDLDGDRAVVGERTGGYDWPFSHRGEIHVFEWSGVRWDHVRELKASDGGGQDGFGAQVAVEGGRIAAIDKQKAFVFEGAGNSWTETAMVFGDDGGAASANLSLDGGRLFFTTWGSPVFGPANDETYVFELVGGVWTKQMELHQASPTNAYCALVAVGGDLVLCEGNGGGSSGEVFAYDLSVPAIGTNYCANPPHEDGGPGVIFAYGSDQVVDNDLHLGASELTMNHFGLFLMSEMTDSKTINGGGTLCLGSPVFRMIATTENSGHNAAIGAKVDLTDLPANQVFLPGSTWHFQCWFRNDDHSSLTDGLSVTWQ